MAKWWQTQRTRIAGIGAVIVFVTATVVVATFSGRGQSTLTPPPPPPTHPSPPTTQELSSVECVHGINMFCVFSDVASYAYEDPAALPGTPLTPGVCQDELAPLPAKPLVDVGHDCAACGYRCCGDDECSYASLSDKTCTCFGKYPIT